MLSTRMLTWPKILSLLVISLSATPALSASQDLLSDLKFTAAELLIYTDQLQKLDNTVCNRSASTPYNRQQTQAKLLSDLTPADREQLSVFLVSETFQAMLAENSQGIARMIPVPSDLLSGAKLNAAVRASCIELGLIFQENLRDTQTDYQRLISEYQQ